MRELEVIQFLIYHSTGTTSNATIEGIVNYWKNTLGWNHGGYQILIDRRGVPYFYDGTTKPYKYSRDKSLFPECLKYITNGVKGHNWNSVHMSWIGGKTHDDRTPEQKATMYKLTKEIIDVLPNKIDIFGHRDFSKDRDGNGIITPNEWSKLCPSMETISWLNKTGLYNYLLSKK